MACICFIIFFTYIVKNPFRILSKITQNPPNMCQNPTKMVQRPPSDAPGVLRGGRGDLWRCCIHSAGAFWGAILGYFWRPGGHFGVLGASWAWKTTFKKQDTKNIDKIVPNITQTSLKKPHVGLFLAPKSHRMR